MGAALLSAMTPPAPGWPEEFAEEVQTERAGDGWRGGRETRTCFADAAAPGGPVVRSYHSDRTAATRAGHCRRAEADYRVGR